MAEQVNNVTKSAMLAGVKMAKATMNGVAVKKQPNSIINGLPSKDNVDGKCYDGLDKILDKVDPSKTRHPKIVDNTEITFFCDKDGNLLLEKHVDEDGRVAYYYKGADGADVSVYDFDGDGNFDQLELEYDKIGFRLQSSKDDGLFDKTSKFDIKS